MRDLLIRIGIIAIFLLLFVGVFYFSEIKSPLSKSPTASKDILESKNLSPLSITAMREKAYPGSELVIKDELEPGANFNRYVASYQSDDLKIYGLLTIPTTEKPEKGYPAIIFNHGYIAPEEYQTTERYIAYQDGFAQQGYVTFKSDYRGHGNSEGNPEGAYFSPAYTDDVLNALASVKRLPYVDKKNIGMWGHSLGGNITQRVLVISPDIKAAVIWGGVVGSYKDIFDNWWSKRVTHTFSPSIREQNSNRPNRQRFIEQYGEPTETNEFWNSVSPTSYLQYLESPVQLHHGNADETVPFTLSQDYEDKLKEAKKTVELYFYPGNDHNISQSFNLAMQRSVEFFDRYLK